MKTKVLLKVVFQLWKVVQQLWKFMYLTFQSCQTVATFATLQLCKVAKVAQSWSGCFPDVVHLLMSLMLSKMVSVTTYKLSNLQGCLDHIGDKGLVVMLKWWRPWSWPGPNHILLMVGLPIRVVRRCLQQSCQVDVVIARLSVNGSGVVVQLRYVIFTVCGMWR